MKSSWLSAALAGAVVGIVALAFAGTLKAQSGRTATGGRIACVNVGNVFDEYQRRKDLLEEMDQVQEALKTEEADRRQKIDALQNELNRLSTEDPTYVERARELLELQIQYRTWGEVKKAHMTRELGLASIKIYGEIVDTIKQIAERDGYDMVFYKGQFDPQAVDFEAVTQQIRDNKLLYAHPSTDLTQVVLDKLNADYRAQPRQKMLYVP